jgi:DtxR family Mn-dependent transcriptional regulator
MQGSDGAMDEKMTPSLENYLETVLVLEQSDPTVRLTDIANKLGVSKASVNRAQGLLKKAGLIEQERYGTITLTEKGREAASDVYKRHRTLKRFLMCVLHIDEETAENDACLMEHVISKQTMDKLVQYLAEQCP